MRHKNLFIRIAPAFIIALSITALSAFIGRQALAAPNANVNLNTRTYRPTKAKPRVVWLLPKSEESYKNAILTAFQDVYLPRHGIHDAEAKKWAAAMIFHENGALSENRDGDHGCSIGIPQRNVCQFGYSAKSFRRAYPTWKTADTQLDWAAQHFADNLKAFGSIRLAVIAHNSPAAAARGSDTKAGYYAKVSRIASILSASKIK